MASLGGISGPAWAFATRIWIAEMGALCVAFWLQIDGAATAAITVAILALQTRGQTFQKAAFRLAGTFLGVVAAIAIAGLFSQARDLYLIAYAAWLSACVFVAGLFDGNRAYGAVLAGYTVANVTVMQIDAPQNVFLGGVNRAAAIVIGIAALTLVSDLFGATNIHPALLAKLSAAREKVRALARSATGDPDPLAIGRLVADISALHPDVTALTAEWPAGRARANAARRAIWSLTGAIEIIGALEIARTERGLAAREAIETGLSDLGRPAHFPFLDRPAEPGGRPRDLDHLFVERCVGNLLEQDRAVSDALGALQSGASTAHSAGLPLYRSYHQAARNAVRAFFGILIAAIPLVLSSWPGTSVALSLIGIVIGLSAANPNPVGFASAVLKAMPTAIATAGVTEFLILDGVSEFPILALAMAPTIFAACLCMSSGKPKLFSFGLLLLVFFPVLLQPSNPQDYNPQSYLFSAILSMTAVATVYVVLTTLLPTTDARKRIWFRRSARRELEQALTGSYRAGSEAAWAYTAFDRIGQLAALQDGTPAERERDMRQALRVSELAAAARQARSALAALPRGVEVDAVRAEGTAVLAARDPDRMRGIAERLLAFGPQATNAVFALVWTAMLIAARPQDDGACFGECR